MLNLMEYKGYHAKIQYSEEDNILFGRVIGITDVVSFDGESISELKEMFHQSIDDYLAMCEEEGRLPDKEYKGSLNVRISPDTHKRAALAAEAQDTSLNQFIQQAIENELSGSHKQEIVRIVLPIQTAKQYNPLMNQQNSNIVDFSKQEVLTKCLQQTNYLNLGS